MPPTQREFVSLESPTATRNGAGYLPTQGLYYTPSGELPRTAFIATHYNIDFAEHYMAKLMAARGYGFLGWNTRFRGIEAYFSLEHALIDIGAGVRWLREHAGVDNVVLLGNSGGGSLMAAYQSQATDPNLQPLLGAAVPDAVSDLMPGDYYVSTNAHMGRPEVLTDWFDPAVTDETDPTSVDPALDMYNADNGPPYSAEFIERYRSAQRARNNRITKWALNELERLREAGSFDRMFNMYRTWADPRYFDASLDPNDREIGVCYLGPPKRREEHRCRHGGRLAQCPHVNGGVWVSSRSDRCPPQTNHSSTKLANRYGPRMSDHSHGPWVDVHSHPGRCFLGGLEPTSPFVALLGPDESRKRVHSALAGEVAVVNSATVADLAILGVRPDGAPYASREFEPGEAVADHDRQLKALSLLLADDDVIAVLGPDDIDTAANADEPGVFISCEGADFLDGRLDGVAGAYEYGARSVTLVHYRVNELGDIQTDDVVHRGLTSFGRDVVREMNRLGMIVDLAHATFDVTVGALEESSAPIMISHSHLARSGADHPRLLSAEHASVVAEGGGLIGAWPAGVAIETLDDYCVEICRLVDVVGMDHVAIGTDLDANYKPVLTSYEQFPEVAVCLGDRGMSSAEVDQILGGNFIDLFRAVVGEA